MKIVKSLADASLLTKGICETVEMDKRKKRRISRYATRYIRYWGVIHIVRTHKGGEEGSNQMRTIAYKGEGEGFKVAYVRKNFFLYLKILKLFFFCKKEAATIPFTIVYRKV